LIVGKRDKVIFRIQLNIDDLGVDYFLPFICTIPWVRLEPVSASPTAGSHLTVISLLPTATSRPKSVRPLFI
jgi:hypothetical protein